MSDDFNSRYRLLKCVAVEEGIRTHNAQELATGRVVMVHLADAAGPEDVDRLQRLLSGLSDADRNRILETATLASGFAVVTEFLAGLVSFPAWLAQRSLSKNRPPALTVPDAVVELAPTPLPLQVPPAESKPPSAFTLMFGAPNVPGQSSHGPPQQRPIETSSDQSRISIAALSNKNQTTEPRVAPGEFTRMFSKPATAAPLPQITPPSPVALPISPAVPSPVIPGLPVPVTALNTTPSPTIPPLSPGEQAWPPVAATPTGAQPPSPLEVPLFGNAFSPLPSGPASPLVPAAPISAKAFPIATDGGATSAPAGTSPLSTSGVLFDTPSGGGGPGILPPPIFAPGGGHTPLSPLGDSGPAAARTTGPSDFTRMISKAPAPVVSTPAQSVASDQRGSGILTGGKRKRNIPVGLIIVINAVVLIAIVLIAVVSMRPAPAPPASTPPAPQVPQSVPQTPTNGSR